MFIKIAYFFRIFILGLVILLLSAFLSLAQETNPTSPLADQTWVRLGGPPGGLGYDIRMRPDNPDIMYVTDAFAGVHKSVDGGKTWFNINEGIDARTGPSGDAVPIFSLTIDPNNYDIIWIGSQNFRGVYRSEDGGNTWEKRVNGINEDEIISIRGIGIEPGNSNVVYIAGEIEIGVRGFGFSMVKGVVYKSTDAGLNWRVIWQGDSLARYVLIDPEDVNIIYMSTGIFDREAFNSDHSTNTPGGEGVLKSTDGGITWFQVNEGLENLYIPSLAIHPEDSQILLAAAGNVTYQQGGSIYVTRNGGEHWEKVIGDEGMAVEFSTSDPDIWYASGGGSPFYTSLDGGENWQSYTSPGGHGWRPAGFRGSVPIDMQADPRDPQRIFVNNYGGGNYLSEDGGQTWISSSTGYTGAEIWDVTVQPNNPAIVYANGRGGPFRSTNGGMTWQGINPVLIQDGPQIVIDPQDPDRILASEAQFGMTFESNDAGKTWRQVTDFHNLQDWAEVPTSNQSGMYAMVFAPSDPSIVYGGFGTWGCVASRGGGECIARTVLSLLTSRDGGRLWEVRKDVPFDGQSVTSIVVHPLDENVAWVATGGGGVFRTHDGGTTWELTSNQLSGMELMALAIDTNNPSVLFAGAANNGMFKSQDGGNTWHAINTGMNPNEPISSIVIDPIRSNVIYAGSRFSGVFVSEDAGASWRLITDGLRTRAVSTLSINADGETLYAGTLGEGVFRLSTFSQDHFDQLSMLAQPKGTSLPEVESTKTSIPQMQTETSIWGEDENGVQGSSDSGMQNNTVIFIAVGIGVFIILGVSRFAITWRNRRNGT